MNIRGLDLNLLLVLDAVMAERNVTRAARRLGLSQPAVSNALSRLRARLGDPLFLRTPTGITPTEFAVTLAGPVREALALLSDVGSPKERFEPGTSHRRFVLAMSDHAQFVLLPGLLSRLRRSAPSLTIEVRSSDRGSLREMLERGDADLGVARTGTSHADLRRTSLFGDRYVCLTRAGHPAAAQRLTLKRYARLSHVMVASETPASGMIDQFLDQHGLRRHVAVRVSHFLLVPEIVAETDLVAALSERLAQRFVSTHPLKLLAPPFPAELTGFEMCWHPRTEPSRAHEWLRGVLQQVGRDLPDGRA